MTLAQKLAVGIVVLAMLAFVSVLIESAEQQRRYGRWGARPTTRAWRAALAVVTFGVVVVVIVWALGVG